MYLRVHIITKDLHMKVKIISRVYVKARTESPIKLLPMVNITFFVFSASWGKDRISFRFIFFIIINNMIHKTQFKRKNLKK